MTQRELVLQALRSAGEGGVCVSELPTSLSYTMRNRISELRRENVLIEGSRCTRHSHKAHVYSYRLVAVGQQAMAL